MNRAPITATCGECDHWPCLCPRVDDADICWLGRREGGYQAVRA
jgi:hypothetical protein